jgi:cysteine desulfurase
VSTELQAYLDHAATSPLRPEALAAMLPLLGEHFGNPSAANSPGRRARLALDDSREDVADCFGCEPGEVVFCSGGTEAANLAVYGTMAAAGAAAAAGAGARAGAGDDVAGGVICSAIEHPSVLRAVESLGGTSFGVRSDGVVDLDELDGLLRPDTRLVAVMLANNEIGTIQPIAEVAALVRRRSPGAVLVVDAVHAASWMDLAAFNREVRIDILFVSAHKFGGPKGAGALVVRNRVAWAPVGRGGAQERGRRPGTENVPGIAGMAAALRATTVERPQLLPRISSMRDRLLDGILGSVEGVLETGTSVRAGSDAGIGGVPGRSGKVPGSCHLLVDRVEQDELLFLLDSERIYASAGSACASGAAEHSHVLNAIGIDPGSDRAALRLSLGYSTTDSEIDYAVGVVPKVIEHLRSFS